VPTLERIAFRTAMRAAAVELLEGYAQQDGVTLQVYPGRPSTLHPPTAFVDRIRERVDSWGVTRRQRQPAVSVVVLHGLFDSANTVEQGDTFVDGFLAYVQERYHAAHENTLLQVTATQDEPNYVPDWLPAEQQRHYYATVVLLEGLSLD